jgi:hypothetical protein
MQDDEIMGGALRLMHAERHNSMINFGKIYASLGVTDAQVIRSIQSRMEQKGLIQLKARPVGSPAGHGVITDYGIEVFEGKVAKPMPMVFHNVTISGSTNIQLGQGNSIQANSFEIGKIIAAIDHSNATENEKEVAKSLLQKLSENPLLNSILGKLTGDAMGG